MSATPRDRRSSSYHHGALREALLEAGEVELEEKGVEGFSLRGVARRAGVSHAAPAHHFGDVDGVLTALATVGFRRFLDTMRARQRDVDTAADPAARYVASGLGYIDFATASPALFRLMFSSNRPDFEAPALKEASDRSFLHLVDDVRHLRALEPLSDPDPDTTIDIAVGWALAHGLADLLTSGRLRLLGTLPAAERERALAVALRRIVGAA